MNKVEIKGEDLKVIGYPEGKVIGTVMRIIEQNYKDVDRRDILAMMAKVIQYPENFLDDEVLSLIAKDLLEKPANDDADIIPLKETGDKYAVYGAQYIEPGASAQMDVAMKLPVTVAGALMPDAHQGYGLPIGGVLATNNAIIPYGVGVDIGCRMALSVYDIPEAHFIEHAAKYKRELIAWTSFGAGARWTGKWKADHAVLSRNEFNSIPVLKKLHDKAASQLGTSGGGNHFVEGGSSSLTWTTKG